MRVSEIWRYPVKSLKGEQLNTTTITKLGVPGDRQIVVLRASTGRVLTSRVKPKLLGLQGGVDSNGQPTINGLPWDSPEALEQVTSAVGEPVALHPVPAPQAFDVLPLLVATDGAVNYLGIDHRRLRPNILIADVPELEERKWEGGLLAIGDCRIRTRNLRGRCVMTTFDPDTQQQDINVLKRIVQELDGSMALDSSVEVEGAIRVGDEVRLVSGQ